MADQQPNAPVRAQAPIPSEVPPGGIQHITRRHPDRYTIVGNHLAQHRDLSLTAMGLAVHIQSLPSGTDRAFRAPKPGLCRDATQPWSRRRPDGNSLRVGNMRRDASRRGM